MKHLGIFLLAAAVLNALAHSADAALSVRLSDSTSATTITVTDNGAGDINPTLGVVVVSTSVGSFTVNTTTGLGFPFLDQTHLDLNSVNVNITTPTTLDVFVSVDNLTAPFLGGNLHWGGTLSGSAGSTVTTTAFLSNPNNLFGTETTIATLGPFAGPAFSGSTSGPAVADGQYALTIRTRIVATGSVQYSGDAELNAIPEPVSIAAWSVLSLAGLAFARRSRKVE